MRRQWTTEHRDEVAFLWRLGHSAREIAAHFDASVNALTALVHRMRREGLDVPRRYRRAT